MHRLTIVVTCVVVCLYLTLTVEACIATSLNQMIFLYNCIPKFYTVCLAETWPIALDFYSQDE